MTATGLLLVTTIGALINHPLRPAVGGSTVVKFLTEFYFVTQITLNAQLVMVQQLKGSLRIQDFGTGIPTSNILRNSDKLSSPDSLVL